jgi:hypothetical protein
VLADAVEVAVGDTHACALRKDDKVSCWGYAGRGALGDGHVDEEKPAVVAGLASVAQIAGASTHACAVTKSGAAYCWGRNGSGELGDGTKRSRAAPVRVAGVDDATQIDIAADTACAIKKSGAVVCWGKPSGAQRKPVVVAGVNDAVAIAVGLEDSCVVRRSGAVACFVNERPSLGVRAVPGISDAVGVATNGAASLGGPIPPAQLVCALRRGGDLACWTGVVRGDNDALSVQVGARLRGAGPAKRVEVAGAGAFVQVCTIGASGEVACANMTAMHLEDAKLDKEADYVRLARRVETDSMRCDLLRAGLVDCRGVVSDVRDAVDVVAGQAYACALLKSGEVTCWGMNQQGALGRGSFPWARTPALVKLPGTP